MVMMVKVRVMVMVMVMVMVGMVMMIIVAKVVLTNHQLKMLLSWFCLVLLGKSFLKSSGEIEVVS
jgi:hypothetical protein